MLTWTACPTEAWRRWVQGARWLGLGGWPRGRQGARWVSPGAAPAWLLHGRRHASPPAPPPPRRRTLQGWGQISAEEQRALRIARAEDAREAEAEAAREAAKRERREAKRRRGGADAFLDMD